MNKNRTRQICRLEKRMQPHIERIQKLKSKASFESCLAASHAACLAFIIRYGRPQIGEPLWRACNRVGSSEAWRECCRMFPVALGRVAYEFRPYADFLWIVMPIRHGLIRFFPGHDEKEKLNRAFESAPPWLIWFSHADHTARKLGLRLPDLSTVAGYQRPRFIEPEFAETAYPGHKFQIPKGAFVPTPWPDGIVTVPPARVKIVEAGWPKLFSKELIELTRKENSELSHASDWTATFRAIVKRKAPDSDADWSAQ